MMRILVVSLALVSTLAAAPQPNIDKPWAPLSFLLGEWVGKGGGESGQGSGGFSFELELERNVLVRKNRADYAATQDRPAYHHEDLMIVYKEPGEDRLRAIYFDNEGHVIHYAVEPSGDGVRFLSDALPSSPRYRLSYRKLSSDTVALKFEIAPPGKPEAFSTYIEATAQRKPSR